MHDVDLARRRILTSLLAAALLSPATSFAAEPYEGAWAKTLKECNDPDGAISLTIIGLDIPVDGRRRSMIEQYEHHCFMDGKTIVGGDTMVTATCYEFWDDFKKNVNGTKEAFKLSVASEGTLTINCKSYLRCPGGAARKKP